jgi:hypothetical protein
MSEPTTFERWCELSNAKALPAAPMLVARFVADLAPLGMSAIWPAVQEISRAHYTIGLADPTLGGLVSAAINEIAKIDPPRSWPADQKRRFQQLPYDLQLYVTNREKQRDAEVRRAQNKANQKVKDGKPENVAA